MKIKGQEEMVGFALIIIIVAVIILVFIGFSLRDDGNVTDDSYTYKVKNFVEASLQYTTDCADNYEPAYYTIRKLISACNREEICLDERNTCDVLDSTLKGIVEKSWEVGKDTPIKGYNMSISSGQGVILEISRGNTTNNYKGSIESLGEGGTDIFFISYY